MYVYEATLEKTDEGYFATVPLFDACYADGKTIEQAVESIATVLKLCIADLLDEGTPLPKPEFSEDPKLGLCVEVDDEFHISTRCNG